MLVVMTYMTVLSCIGLYVILVSFHSDFFLQCASTILLIFFSSKEVKEEEQSS